MKTIRRSDGVLVNLSDEVYVICDMPESYSRGLSAYYQNGTNVRLISGIDGNSTPGYHFSQGHVTVCRIDATGAEFIGIHEAYIQPLEAIEDEPVETELVAEETEHVPLIIFTINEKDFKISMNGYNEFIKPRSEMFK